LHFNPNKGRPAQRPGEGYIMATTNNIVNGLLILTACPRCSVCKGSGAFRESTGEHLSCDCAFENAPENPQAQRLIDAGKFCVEPTPEYLAEIERIDRSIRSHEDSWIDSALHGHCEDI
jgi:hypothetical protein